MASIWILQLHSLSFQPSIWAWKRQVSPNVVGLKTELVLNHSQPLNWSQLTTSRKVLIRAISGSMSSEEEEEPTQNVVVKAEEKGLVLDLKHPISRFRGTISSFPSVALMMKRYGGSNLVIGFCVATAILVLAVRAYVVRKSKHANPGSVADLVRRGHLRSDRRGISRPLKYDDPFNNPLVKSKGNSTVEMCGKVYRLAPITLTREQQAIHQKRRSRAYQWKRPTVFLKEGDSAPPDVDPDTIRWIPANHPFATTVSDIDEDLAQNNVYQKHGVPFRIQAEHEALQRKLEALQNDEKLRNPIIDGRNAKDFQKPFNLYSKSNDPQQDSLANNQVADFKPPKPEHDQHSSQSTLSSEEMQKP
ncbi:hypothetical protein SLE2022_174750 [Rubroshorea leprosula]